MRLRKLLLGSAAAVMVAGAASVPAKAADVNGLVVTMANYLESCANGNGIQLTTWCLAFNGSATAKTTLGSTLDYMPGAPGTNFPGVQVENPEGSTTPWSGFSLVTRFGVTATAETPNGKTITIKLPIVGGGSTSLAISRPGAYTMTFTGGSWTLSLPTSVATFTIKLSEDIGAWFWPDLDLTAKATMGNFTGTGHVAIGADNTDVNGLGVGIFFAPAADLSVAYSDGFDFGAGVNVARVWNGGPVTAFGANVSAGVTFGMFSLSAGVAHSINADFMRSSTSDPTTNDKSYQYDLIPGERIWEAWGQVVADWNSQHRTTLSAYYAVATTTAGSDTLKIDLQHRFRPYGNSLLTLTGELWYQHAFAPAGDLNAIGGGLTIGTALP